MSLPNLEDGSGERLLESTSLFKAGIAAILYTESLLLDKLLERNESTEVLLRCNDQIVNITVALMTLETQVVQEIEKEKR